MIKLFFTQYLMVLASFILFIALVSGIGLTSVSIAEREIIDSKIAIGTFSLLEKSITGKTPLQTKQIIAKYKEVFGPEFSLLEQTLLKKEKYNFTNDD